MKPNPEERARIIADGLKHAEASLLKTTTPQSRLTQKGQELNERVRLAFLSRSRLLARPMRETEALSAIHILYRDSFASWDRDELIEYLSTFLARQAVDYMKEASHL